MHRWALAVLLWLAAVPANAAYDIPVGKFISTQTASAAAAMTFTGLSGFLNYFLACSQVYPATDQSVVKVQFGEGATPTWETAGSYYWANMTMSSASTSQANGVSTTDTGIAPAGGGTTNALTAGISFWGYLNDVTTSGATHGFTWTGIVKLTNLYVTNGAGIWTADTNPITAVRVLASSGNISGKCTLYGLDQ